MQQYFLKQTLHLNDVFDFDSEQSHHIKNVLRMKNDDIVRVVDEEEKVFYAKLHVSSKVSGMAYESIDDQSELNVDVTLIQGMIKGEKWDYLLQKCSELGIKRIVPLISSRCVVKAKEDKLDKKLERWNKITLEACEQCKRSHKVEVCAPVGLKDLDKYISNLNLVAYEDADVKSCKLSDVLKSNHGFKSITYVIGPEGGFSLAEVEMMEDKGFTRVSLGNRILRAETAALSLLNSIDFYLEMSEENEESN